MIATIGWLGLQRGLSKAYSTCDVDLSTSAAEASAAGSPARAARPLMVRNIATVWASGLSRMQHMLLAKKCRQLSFGCWSHESSETLQPLHCTCTRFEGDCAHSRSLLQALQPVPSLRLCVSPVEPLKLTSTALYPSPPTKNAKDSCQLAG